MQKKYKLYKKSADYSYSAGIFPTLELLTACPEAAQAVFIAPNSQHSQGVQKILTLCAKHHIPCSEDARTIARLTRNDQSFAVGIFSKISTALDVTAPHVVLISPDDAGNLGTILRTMLGFGHRNLAIISPAVDVFDPKVIRASMGAIFRQRIAYFSSFTEYAAAYPQHIPYPFILKTSNALQATVFKTPYSLVFGNEGSGLPQEFSVIGTPVRIEQTNDIDSLNLAVSVSVALYAAFSQK